MLTLKTIGPEGLVKKKEAGTTEKCLFYGVNHGHLWLTATLLPLVHQNVLIIVPSGPARRSIRKSGGALDNEEKALWLAKAAETNRPAMKRIHSAKWRSKAAQEQRAAEQAVRDAAKQEAVEVYKTFSELDLEIVVDVRSFTITHLAEPEEIVLPETRSSSSTNENKDLYW
jgi:hypothetical protein